MLGTAAERRSVPRQPAKHHAAIWIAGVKRACVVTDRSPKGVRLTFGTDHQLPLRFELQFAGTRLRLPAQLVWQQGCTAGVHLDLGPTILERLGLK